MFSLEAFLQRIEQHLAVTWIAPVVYTYTRPRFWAIWQPPYFSSAFPAEAVTAHKAEPPASLESRRVPAKRVYIYICVHPL